MGSNESRQPEVAGALFGRTRRAVLALLRARPDESFYLREVVRLVRCGQGGVQRELKRLERAGILSRTVRGRTVFYRANQDCPALAELRGLIVGGTVASASAGPGRVIPPPMHPLQEPQPLAASGQTTGGPKVWWVADMPPELL